MWWAAIRCVVPVCNDDTCRDGSEDAVSEGAVATEEDGGNNVEDQDEDRDDDLGEAEAEGVCGESEYRFARHGGGRGGTR